jgi:hypothetical protein
VRKALILFSAWLGLVMGQQPAPIDPCCGDQFPCFACARVCFPPPLDEMSVFDSDGVCVPWEPVVCGCSPWRPEDPYWYPCVFPAPMPVSNTDS